MSKNLKYFMREAAEVEKVVTVPAPESFKDENGKVIQLEVKVLSSERIRAINEGYHTHTVALDKKGNPYINGGNVVFRDERDNAKATRHILVEALQYPKLDDPELMKYYNCVDITQMPEKVFSRADEFAHVTRVVMALLGIGGQLSEEEQKQADEKEIDDAKLIRSAGSETYWAHVLWQRHGLRPEEFDRMSRRQKLFYIASEEEESARPCRRDTMKLVPIRR